MQDFEAAITLGTYCQVTQKKKPTVYFTGPKEMDYSSKIVHFCGFMYKPPKSTGHNIFYCTSEDYKAQDYRQMFIDQKKKQNTDMIQTYPHKANSKCIFEVLRKVNNWRKSRDTYLSARLGRANPSSKYQIKRKLANF